MNPVHLSVYIWMFLNDLQRDAYIEVPSTFFNFTETVDNGHVLGTAQFTNVNITGFETLVSEINNIQATEDDDGNNNLCAYIPVGFLKFTTDYVLDIGIADEIPIYGEGQFQYSCNDIELTLCTFLSLDGGYVKDVNVNLQYRHNPIIFTGFWRNDEVTQIIVRFMNVFNWLFAMWTAYEPERASCVFSPFVEYIFNNNMGYEDNRLEFNITCLQGILKDIEGSSENMEEYLNIAMLENNAGGDDLLKSFMEENKYSFSVWSGYVVSYIRRLLNG